MAGNGVQRSDHEIFQELMQVSTIRGQDGTGIIQANFKGDKKSTWMMEKKALEVNHFFMWAAGKEGNKLILNSLYDNVYIGHVRDATKGDLTAANCHPFKAKSIIGVHNGTLDDFEYQHKDKSDSKLLYDAIAEKGIKKVLEDIYPTGAYALNWIDTATEKVYFARNEKRPLHVVKNLERAVVYWASESGMLEWILNRNKVNYDQVLYFKPDQVYSLDPTKIKTEGKGIPWEIEEYKSLTWEDLPISKYYKSGKAAKQAMYYDLWGCTGYDPKDWEDQEPRVDADTTATKPTNITCNEKGISLPQVGGAFSLSGIEKKVGKIPHAQCFGCHKDLSPVQQYMADQVLVDGRTLFECQDCVNLAESLGNTEKRALQ